MPATGMGSESYYNPATEASCGRAEETSHDRTLVHTGKVDDLL